MRRLLEHPLARGRDLDDPATTALRRQILATKPFLRHIYDDWYKRIDAWLGDGPEPVLELGAGAGYAERIVRGVLKSDVQLLSGLDIVLDATALPFGAATLRGIMMTNVLHHVHDPRAFFAEANRCLVNGGAIAMIEPWVTPWSAFVYRRFHHEPFEPEAAEWKLPAGGPLSCANGALPWIIFGRDRKEFAATYPSLNVVCVEPFMPFRYLLSGGMSLRALMPGWSTVVWRGVELLLSPLNGALSMFALIVVEKRTPPATPRNRLNGI